VELLHIQPGKPTQNASIEGFNRTFRTKVLDRYVFTRLHEGRRMTEDWRYRYNHQRPHRALGGLSPVAYAMASSITSTSQ
jgi:putative transposase